MKKKKLIVIGNGMAGARTVEEFLAWFPGVLRSQVQAVLEHNAV